MKVTVTGGTLTAEEIKRYIDYAEGANPHRKITALDIELDGDYANLTYHCANTPFERIRRITGYLVGTLDRFNNAKRAEVEDRVKHRLTVDESGDVFI